MKTKFLVALLLLAFCLPTASALSFSGLAQTYILIDQILMQLY